ncbi:hypothetical protein INT46_000452 [Mucor plumbeus]|uniref:BHLH domain-containing protein n=1 Tax=Mucor plumbeus TaxID=97098 RepID=A0A8H7QR68_9FUNG|nr:hypothetical protein INT46_000452 [Mucor plumbeus]
MNSSMNNTAFGFESYNFMSTAPPFTPTKMNYYDTQLYPTAAPVTTTNTAGYYGYEPIVSMTSGVSQPVVPSQIDMYNSMPSSPESAASSASCSPLVVSSNANTSSLPSCLSLTKKINERIAQVNKLPDSFLPEFHQYSKETYENGGSCMKKRRRRHCNSYDSEDADDYEMHQNGASAAELRRQVHIQSEQKRRAQIKDGFDVLRQYLPGCANKKMSKAALLHRTVQHLQHLKKNQTTIVSEIERLVQENEELKSAAAAASSSAPAYSPIAAQQKQRVFI